MTISILTLDFETAFDADYTLKKLTTEAYIRDPRFKAHLVGIKYNDQPAVDVPAHLLHENQQLRHDIEQSAVLCHHAHFDGLILSHHYNLRPKFWLDTLSMSRATVRDIKVGGSLAALLKHFNLSGKTLNYATFKGVRDLGPALYREVADGCKVDTNQTYELFKILRPLVPDDELRVIDTVVRMFTEPCLELDVPRCTAFLQAERRRKAELMLRVAVGWGWDIFPLTEAKIWETLAAVETELQSSDKFRTALESLGYECPVKWSDKARCVTCAGTGYDDHMAHRLNQCPKCNGTGKGGYIPAIAKNDPAMQEMLEHDDGRVSALASARLGVKSTIDETRASRLISTFGRGTLPVYLSYGAAKTLRFGGGDKSNWQNFRRGGEIRKSIKAPGGRRLLIVDKSQIEYRLLCYVAGQFDKLDALREGRDLYCEFSTELHGWTVTKQHKPERGIGKQGCLSCGYGAGGPSIQRTAKLGTYGPPVELTLERATAVRDLYRRLHPCVKRFWNVCGDHILPSLAAGGTFEYTVPGCDNPLLTIRDHQIWLPNGQSLDFHGLRWGYYANEPGPMEEPAWWERTREGWARIWGSALTAYIIQALAGVMIRDAMVRIAPHLKIALQVHDELIMIVPDTEPLAGETAAGRAPEGTWLSWALNEMVKVPSWADDRLVLGAEGQVSEIYSK